MPGLPSIDAARVASGRSQLVLLHGRTLTIGLVLPEDPRYAQGYRYVVRSPGHVIIAYYKTERDADARNRRQPRRGQTLGQGGMIRDEPRPRSPAGETRVERFG
jgi:hypothetical protein